MITVGLGCVSQVKEKGGIQMSYIFRSTATSVKGNSKIFVLQKYKNFILLLLEN